MDVFYALGLPNVKGWTMLLVLTVTTNNRTTLESLNNTWTTVGSGNNSRERGGGVIEKNAKKFPNLSVMARQYLGCPATSATVERLISQVGISFSPNRQRAQAATVVDIIFTKINVAWLYESWDEITSAVVALCFYRALTFYELWYFLP